MMRYNKLNEIDDAKLVGPDILLVPTGDGSN